MNARECPAPAWDESPDDGKHHFDGLDVCIKCGYKKRTYDLRQSAEI